MKRINLALPQLKIYTEVQMGNYLPTLYLTESIQINLQNTPTHGTAGIVRKRRLIYARTYSFPVIQNNLYSLEMHELTFLFLPLFHVFCTV